MGILRLFLALSVLDWHYRFSDSAVFPYSFSAVLCFFVISGFYMSLVINEKYGSSPKGIGRFYCNRALRLYPVNIAVWVCFLGLYALGAVERPPGFLVAADVSLASRAAVILDQLLIFPRMLWENLLLFPDAQYNHLYFGQLYTIGLELIFYAFAPFIVTRRLSILLMLTGAAAILHFGFYFFNLPARPWQYEFFPGVLVFFLMGCLAYRLLPVVRGLRLPPALGFLALPVFVAFCAVIPKGEDVFTNSPEAFALYLLTMIALPFLFEASKNANWDRLIGDLSYPVYAVQLLVGRAMVGRPGNGTIAENLLVLVVVLLASVALVYLVERPVERLRSQIARRGLGGLLRVPIAQSVG